MSKPAYIRETLWKDGDVEAYSEFYDGNYYVHVVIENAKPSTIKKIKEGWASILEWAKSNNLNHIYTYTENVKFLRFFPGYTLIGNTGYIPEAKKSYEVVEWELEY